jgi:protein-tyrosine phosphatase
VSAPWLVDVHSHVVPSGDDGAATVEEGVELCRLAVEAGTRVLFTTPHVHAPWDSYPWSPARERLYDDSFPTVREGAAAFGLDVRRGWELFPSEVLERDPEVFRLEGTEAVLVEFRGSWLDLREPLRLVRDAVERVQAAGLTPVLAHPERCRAVAVDAAVRALVEEGALLCLNAGSLVGDHGAMAQRVAWRLVEDGVVALAASDGHGARRPPTMDAAWMAAVARLGEGRARPLFDGSALPWTDAGMLRAGRATSGRRRSARSTQTCGASSPRPAK